MASREAVMTALLAQLALAWPFASVSRRNPGGENLDTATTPALFLVEYQNTYKTVQGQALHRILTAHALIYHDTGPDPNAIAGSMLNNILDGFDRVALQPMPPWNTVTLGGLVRHVMIEGTVEMAPGYQTGKSLAIIPIHILLP